MSTILDVYLHGSAHLTNPGSEELFIGILARGFHTAVAAPEGPGGFPGPRNAVERKTRSTFSFGKLKMWCSSCGSVWGFESEALLSFSLG